MPFDRDASSNDVINGENTYAAIAEHLECSGDSIIIGWTDGFATHHDILFCKNPTKIGTLRGGLNNKYVIFVSVLRVGCFGFDLDLPKKLCSDYVAEKLGVYGDTADRIATLINNVRERLV